MLWGRHHTMRCTEHLAGFLAIALGTGACQPSLPTKPEQKEVKISRDLDCGGKPFQEGREVHLLVKDDGIRISNCRITGTIRVLGLTRNGNGAANRESSYRPGHTQRAQDAASRGVIIEGNTIISTYTIPIYAGPGVTDLTIRGNTFQGKGKSVVVYLDAESARNTIEGNTFAFRSLVREVVAVDGSAQNRIADNDFQRIDRGGIYLYRNCGEAGAVRHQPPRENIIEGNRFATGTLLPLITHRVPYRPAAIVLGSRNGSASYCDDDKGYSFGSSADDRDQADFNIVRANIFTGSGRQVVDNGKQNAVQSIGSAR
ncbi:MAG: right-handed parallel beta-helix repeat-containing protein [Prochlorococcaceae cyanobacterium]